MLDLGTVKPGSTIRIPFSSFDKDDGSSVTMTNYTTADILVYKDGGTTERASAAGYVATTDFDGKTGKHLAVIDLADNTTADFFQAGSEYLVAIDSVTVDAVTTGAWIGRFTIGYPDANLDTFIATLTNQTSFTLNEGPAEDDALNGHWAIIHDAASKVQRATVRVLDYTGSTKTVTLVAGATFTVAAKDNFSLMDLAPLQPSTLGRTLDVSTGGEAGLDWANIGSPTTAQNLSATNIDVDQVVASVTGAVGSVTGAVGSVTGLTPATVHADLDDIQARLPAALVSGRMDSSVGAMAANTLTASALATDAVTEIQTGLATSSALATVQADTDDIQTRLPAALVSGRMDSSVGAMAADVVTASAIATDAIGALELAAGAVSEIATGVRTELATELGRIDVAVSTRASQTSVDDLPTNAELATALGTADDAVLAQVALVKAKTDNLPTDPADASDIAAAFSSLSGQVTTVDTVVDAIKVVTDKLDNTLENTSDGWIFTVNALQNAPTGGSAPTAAAIADAVWEEAIADHSGTSGSTAEALAAAGSAGDPWATALPGAYGAGSAGFIVGTNLDATVSSRATQTSVDDLPTNAELATALGTADDAVLAQIALVKAKTDALPTDPADASDIAASFATVNTKLDTIDDFVDTEVAAIKAKTDNLPTDPADASDIAAAFSTVNGTLATLATSSALATVDTVVDAIKVTTDKLDGMLENTSDGWIWTVVALQNAPTDGAAPTSAAIADAVWDEVVDGAFTARQSVRIQNSIAAGKSSGHDLLTPVFRDLADTKDRVSAPVDEFGNRSTVTIDAS